MSVLVVGGGLAGLLVAEHLAAAGVPVEVVEKEERFGGYNALMAPGGVPLVCYSALGLEPDGTLRRVLDASDDAPPRRAALSDLVLTPRGPVELPGRLEAYVESLADRFPGERAALEGFGREIRSIYDAIEAVVSAPATPPMAALGVLRQAVAVPYRERLDALFGDPSLRRLLAIRLFASTNTTSTMAAYLGKILIDGLWQLPGAGSRVTLRVLDRLESASCGLHAGFDLARAQRLDDGRWRIESTEGAMLEGDALVVAMDYLSFCDRLDDASIADGLRAAVDGARPSLSALCSIRTIRPEAASTFDRYRDCARLVWCDDVDLFELFERREAGALDLSTLKINIDRDPSGVARRLYLEVDCALEAVDPAASTSDAARSDLASRLDAVLERALPGTLEGLADEAIVLTPHDFQRLTRNSGGAASGWRDDTARPVRLDALLRRHGLAQVGQWSGFGTGLSQLETGARIAARELVRRHLRQNR